MRRFFPPFKGSLLALILRDLWRFKWSAMLFLAVLGSAFAVILVTNMSRVLTASHDDLMAEEDRLNTEWRHLLLEQGTLAEHSRVASLAMDKLDMARPLGTTEKVISQP
ncbi:MAG: cell division protein FtsL [Aeromonas sp.]